MSVFATSKGIPHYMAQCRSCSFEECYGGRGGMTIETVRRKARAHAEKTGHTVNIEYAVDFTYQKVGP